MSEDIKDVFTDLCLLALNLLPVSLDHGHLGFDPSDSPQHAAGTNNILICDREKITLFNCEFLVGQSDVLHVLNHLFILLSLLSEVSGIVVDIG